MITPVHKHSGHKRLIKYFEDLCSRFTALKSTFYAGTLLNDRKLLNHSNALQDLISEYDLILFPIGLVLTQ